MTRGLFEYLDDMRHAFDKVRDSIVDDKDIIARKLVEQEENEKLSISSRKCRRREKKQRRKQARASNRKIEPADNVDEIVYDHETSSDGEGAHAHESVFDV